VTAGHRRRRGSSRASPAGVRATTPPPGWHYTCVTEPVAGVVFALGAPAIGLELDGAIAVGLGLAYGIALMIGGMAFWMRLVIGREPDRGMLVTFGAVHLTYGLVLGAFLGAGLVA